MNRPTSIRLLLALIYFISTPASARWYDTGTGRLLSEDPLLGDALTTQQRLPGPIQLNPWLYGNGNPLLYTDPDGRCPVELMYEPGWFGDACRQQAAESAAATLQTLSSGQLTWNQHFESEGAYVATQWHTTAGVTVATGGQFAGMVVFGLLGTPTLLSTPEHHIQGVINGLKQADQCGSLRSMVLSEEGRLAALGKCIEGGVTGLTLVIGYMEGTGMTGPRIPPPTEALTRLGTGMDTVAQHFVSPALEPVPVYGAPPFDVPGPGAGLSRPGSGPGGGTATLMGGGSRPPIDKDNLNAPARPEPPDDFTPASVRKKANRIWNDGRGGEVHVRTAREAREILSILEEQHGLKPATEQGQMPNPNNTMANGFSDPPGTYRGDLINKGNPGAPVHPEINNATHKYNPHYNIKLPTGQKAAIIIDGDH